MTLYAVQSTLFRLKKDKAFAQAFRTDAAAALEPLELTDAERAALGDGDLAALYRMGAHPLLLAPYARLMAIPRPRYQALLEPLRGTMRMSSRIGAP
jgi:hypothetical protein